MTDKKDETGKGPAKPGDTARRPHATIDLQATEVGGRQKPSPGASALPPPDGSGARRPGLAARLAAARGWSRRATQSNTFLSHVAAGVAGAILTFAASALFGLLTGTIDRGPISPEVEKRLAELEQLIRQRPAVAVTGELAAKLAQTDTRLKGLEEQTRAVPALGDTQAKLAANLKSLEALEIYITDSDPNDIQLASAIAWRKTSSLLRHVREWNAVEPRVLDQGDMELLSELEGSHARKTRLAVDIIRMLDSMRESGNPAGCIVRTCSAPQRQRRWRAHSDGGPPSGRRGRRA